MKHLQALSRLPEKADDFTTGEKIAVWSGIAEALASFFETKEGDGSSS